MKSNLRKENLQVKNSEVFYAIGMMSGTSLDGITVAMIKSGLKGENFSVEAWKNYPFSKNMQKTLLETIERGNAHDISLMNYTTGKLYASALKKFFKEFSIDSNRIAVVGMHGQTIFHTDKRERVGQFSVNHTLQIGESAFIAEAFHIDTVSNFRARDIAAGGNGAPLMPFFDYLVFSRYRKRFAVQNLGGIGNVTYVNGTGERNVVAFDTGPCNMILDGAMRMLFDKPFDNEGRIAQSGRVNKKVLKRIIKYTRYLRKPPPKSAGRKDFGEAYLRKIVSFFEGGEKADIIATLNRFVAFTISDAYRRFLGEVDTVVLSGGGALNKKLVSNIKELTEKEVVLSSDFYIPVFAKEAAAFALYALRTKYRLPSTLPHVSGAKEPAVLGVIAYG